MADGAPHPVALSAGTKRVIGKAVKEGKKAYKGLFEAAWRELERSLAVYREYESTWVKDHKVDVARRQLINDIDFDLESPPPLSDLLASDKGARLLRVFAESIFCEEIVSFYCEAKAWREAGCGWEGGKRLCDKYVPDDAVMCLNLEHDVRELVVRTFKQDATAPPATVDATVFDACIYTVTQQMQQNLYYQFILHLRAIRKEQQSRDKLASLQRAISAKSMAANAPELSFVAPSFDDTMSDPIQLQELLCFAGRMYSQERVVFFVLVQEFRVAASEALREDMALRLFSDYIEEDSKRQVSLEGRRHAQITEAYRALCEAGGGRPRGIPVTFFDAVVKEVGRSIKNEIFERFVEWRRAAWERELRSDKPGEAAEAKAADKGGEKTGEKKSLRGLFLRKTPK